LKERNTRFNVKDHDSHVTGSHDNIPYHEKDEETDHPILSTCLAASMTTTLENFVIAHPQVTLSHTDYGQHFYLGCSINILSSPAQRIQAFVEDEGSPYRFIVVGQLTSFRVVEDSVRQGPSPPPPRASLTRNFSLDISCQSTLASCHHLPFFARCSEARWPHYRRSRKLTA
jgi:hypothetical protein